MDNKFSRLYNNNNNNNYVFVVKILCLFVLNSLFMILKYLYIEYLNINVQYTF